MATYDELFALGVHTGLRNRVTVAIEVAAEMIRTESPPANAAQRKAWAKDALSNPGAKAREMLFAVLAARKLNTVAQIIDASDSDIQANVDAAIDLFAGS